MRSRVFGAVVVFALVITALSTFLWVVSTSTAVRQPRPRAITAQASDSLYTYRADVVRVVDGDTLELDVDLGFRVHVDVAARLAHVDAPERRTVAGREALRFVEEWVGANAPGEEEVTVRTERDRTEKYGRYLVEVSGPQGTLNDELVVAGHAQPYEGGRR